MRARTRKINTYKAYTQMHLPVPGTEDAYVLVN
jgi:hypothetical protein